MRTLSILVTQVGCSERTVRRYLKYLGATGQKDAPQNGQTGSRVYGLYRYTSGRKCLEWRGHPRRNQSDGLHRWSLHAALLHPAKRKMRPSKKICPLRNPAPLTSCSTTGAKLRWRSPGSDAKLTSRLIRWGFSRRFHVFAAPKQDAEHTYESLVRTFRFTLVAV